MDFKIKFTPNSSSLGTNKDNIHSFGRSSPEKEVKIPVSSIAKLNRQHTRQEEESKINKYKFLDAKGTEAYDQLRKEISQQSLQKADPTYDSKPPSTLSQHKKYYTQEHHGKQKAEGLQAHLHKPPHFQQGPGSIIRNKDKVKASIDAYSQFGLGGKAEDGSSFNYSRKDPSHKNSSSKLKVNASSTHKFPPLVHHKKQKVKGGKENDNGFPDPTFSLKEIPFPNVQRYKELSDRYYDLLKTHVDNRDDEHQQVSQKVVDYLSTGLYGLNEDRDQGKSPIKSSIKQPSPKKLVRISKDAYEQKTFDPIKSLSKDVSEKLLPAYRKDLTKQEEIHAEIKKMLDPEKIMVYKYGERQTKAAINEDYKKMHEEIDSMETELKQFVKKDKSKYMDEFEDFLRSLHNNYRELEHTNRELSSHTKLTSDIEAKMKEREKLNVECSQIDKIQRSKHDEMMKYKKELSEFNMELSFLEDQVNAAELNEFKLQMRYDELVQEIAEIKAEEEQDEKKKAKDRKNLEDEVRQNHYNNQWGESLSGEAYFQHVCHDFGAYANYIERKNARLREMNNRKPGGAPLKKGLGGMIKESQDEIQELSLPFKKMFQNAIDQTRGEIIQRNIKTRLHLSKNNNTESNKAIQPTYENHQGSVMSSGLESTQSKQSAHQYDMNNPVESKQINLSQFTESDKRNVIQKFLLSHEVLFLVYGLMFPSQTIAAANQALSGPFQPESVM